MINKYKILFKNVMKPDLNSFENRVDPNQLAADQDPYCLPHNRWVNDHYQIRNTEIYKLSVNLSQDK